MKRHLLWEKFRLKDVKIFSPSSIYSSNRPTVFWCGSLSLSLSLSLSAPFLCPIYRMVHGRGADQEKMNKI